MIPARRHQQHKPHQQRSSFLGPAVSSMLSAVLELSDEQEQQEEEQPRRPHKEEGKLHVFASTWNMGGGVEREELLLLERLGLLDRWIPRDPAYDLYVRACVTE